MMQTAYAEPADTTAGAVPLLSFVAAGELFATPLLAVREIIEASHITRIPLTPAFMKGIINLRGTVIPVIDLATRFDRPSEPAPRALARGADVLAFDPIERPCILVTEVNTANGVMPLGALVDSAQDVIEAPATDIEAQPDLGAGLRRDFVLGVVDLGGQVVLVLDFDKVFSPSELAALMEASVARQDEATPGP